MSTEKEVLTEEDLFDQIVQGKDAEQEPVKEDVEETKQDSVIADKAQEKHEAKMASMTVDEYENLKKLVGRVPQLQSQLAQAQKRLSELGNLRSGYNAPESKQPQPAAVEASNADELFKSKAFETLEQEWPDLAAALKSQHSLTKKEVTELKSQIDKIAKSGPGNDRIESIERRLIEREHADKVGYLTTKHPDWSEHVTFKADGNFSHMSKDFAQFWWGLAQELRDSFDPTSLDDSIALMDHFKEQAASVEKQPVQQENKQKEISMKRNSAPQVRGVLPVTATEDLSKLNPEDAWALISKSTSNPFI